MNGGADWQFLRPVYAGDWITRQFRIMDIFEKAGRSGPLVFVVRRETQTNQDGQVVQLADRVSIHRALPVGNQPEHAVNVADELDTVSVSGPAPDVTVEQPLFQSHPQLLYEDISIGTELAQVVKGPLTTTHLVRWAAANGNYARIHWDLPFAQLRQGLALSLIHI